MFLCHSVLLTERNNPEHIFPASCLIVFIGRDMYTVIRNLANTYSHIPNVFVYFSFPRMLLNYILLFHRWVKASFRSFNGVPIISELTCRLITMSNKWNKIPNLKTLLSKSKFFMVQKLKHVKLCLPATAGTIFIPVCFTTMQTTQRIRLNGRFWLLGKNVYDDKQ